MENNFNIAQTVIAALLSSTFIGGIIALITKTVYSPESKNELARIGSEFAQQLLEEAKSERHELRTTIRELEKSVATKEEALARLKHIADEKDRTIRELEQRQYKLARKLEQGLVISLQDIFGEMVPKEFPFPYEEVV